MTLGVVDCNATSDLEFCFEHLFRQLFIRLHNVYTRIYVRFRSLVCAIVAVALHRRECGTLTNKKIEDNVMKRPSDVTMLLLRMLLEIPLLCLFNLEGAEQCFL